MSEVKNGRYEDEYENLQWFKDGLLHREDGPAVIWKYGTKSWTSNCKKHRTSGPTIDWDTGDAEWWINGIELKEDEFNQWLMKKKLNEKLHATFEQKPSIKRGKI